LLADIIVVVGKGYRVILNIGSGNMTYGDIRIDLFKTPQINIIGDTQHLPFKSNIFSIVFSQCVLEHVPNPGEAINEQARVCKPGGKVIVITDNASFWGFHVYGLHSYPLIRVGNRARYIGQKEQDVHYFLFTDMHLRNLFEFAKLHVEEIRSIPFTPIYKNQKEPIYAKFLRLFPFFRRFNNPRIQAVAKKPSAPVAS
jgi:SAM-dependent methyltransferase